MAEANERLLGQGVDLVVDLGGGPETLFTGNPANQPLVENQAAGGDAVQVTDVTGVEVAGFELAAAGNALQVTSVASPAGVDFHDNEISGAGSEAVLISQTVNNASDVRLADNTVAATGNGIDASLTAGSLSLVIDGNTGITSDGNGIDLDGTGGDLYVTSFCGNTVSGDTVGSGILADDVVFDASPLPGGDANFTGDEVGCATATSVGSGGNPVGGHAMMLNNVSGDLAFGDLDLFTDGTGAGGLVVTGTGLLNAAAGSGFEITTTSGTVSSADGPAVDVDPTTIGLVFDAVTSAGSSTFGISLSQVAGSFQVTGATSVSGAGGDGIAVVDSTVAVTLNGQVTVAGTGSEGIFLDDLVGDFSAPSTTSSITGTTGDAFSSQSGEGNVTYNGTITNTSANSVDVRNHGGGAATTLTFAGNVDDDGAGIFLDNNDQGAGSTVNFTGGLDLDTGTNTAFNATNGGIVNVTSGGVSTTADTTSGTLVNIINTTIGGSGVTFDSTNKTGGASGILLTNVGSGAFVSDAGSITNQTSRGVDVSGGSGDVTIDNALGTTATGRSVEVTTHTGGTVTFAGFVDDDGLGIRLESNIGSSLRFEGGMDIDTVGANKGFYAENNSSLEVVGTNDVTTGTAIAVDIDSTTIDTDGVTFRSVSANGAVNGIVVEDTGSTAGFAVTGDGGTAGSGGTIQSTTGDGVRLIATDFASLEWMNITASGGNGIYGTDLDGFSLRDTTLTNNGNAVDEGGLRFADTDPVNPSVNGVTGTAVLENVTLDYPAAGNFGEHHVEIINISGSLDLTMTGSTLRNTNNSTVIGADAFLAEFRNTATAGLDFSTSTFHNNFTDGLQIVAIDSSDVEVVIGSAGNGNTFTDNERAVNLSNATNADLTFEVVDNDITGNNGNSLNIVSVSTATNAAELKGSVDGNRIGTSGVANSGSASGHAIQLDLRGNVDSHISVDGNTIREVNLRGINYDARLGAGDLEAEIINNNIDDAFDGIEMRTRDGHNLCTVISGNTVTNVTGNDAYHIRESDPTHNVATAEASATAQVTNNNTGAPITVDAAVGTVAAGSCDLSGTDVP